MRVAMAAGIGVVLVGLFTSVAKAENWGTDPPPWDDARCLVGSRARQCTDDNGILSVWIDPDLYPVLEAAVENSLDLDYDPINPPIGAFRVSSPSSGIDVLVYDLDFEETNFYAYETCRSGTVHLHGIYSYCSHYMYFNNFFNYYFATSHGRKHAACHEIGHTLGLRHATRSDHPNTYADSCMWDTRWDQRTHQTAMRTISSTTIPIQWSSSE